MGVMHFQVPATLAADDAEALRRAYLGGDYDHSPVPTRTSLANGLLSLRQEKDQSGFLSAPWDIPAAGRVMGSTATLMEGSKPYRFLVELARGKVNQVRSQLADWRHVGLSVPDAVEEHVRKATAAFGRAVLETDPAAAERHAGEALQLAYEAAEALVFLYTEQLFAYRRERGERFDSLLGCRFTDVPDGAAEDASRQTFTAACVPLTWGGVEAQEANYNWEASDRVVEWALQRDLVPTAGPLIDFSGRGLPDWLRTWEGDLPSLASFMSDYVETAVNRYRNRIRRWVICTGSNSSTALGLSEDDQVRLTHRLAEAALGIDQDLEVVVGISQPWGEYLTAEYFQYSPFVFADTLLRAGLPLAGFELEWHMAAAPRGTYCRDPLEASRLLDLFGVLGCPLQVALSYPSAPGRDPLADPGAIADGAGHWHGLSLLAQAEWAETFASLALAKGYVAGVTWDHLSDAAPHHFPHAGLIDAAGARKPAFDRLRIIRETFLKNPDGSMIA
jgi:hypothetical protein